MTRFRLGLALVLCLGLTGVTAHAGDKEEAEKHFRAGVSLQKVEDFEAAIAAFKSSLRIYPTKSALFNLANCLRATHRYGEALKTLERLDSQYRGDLDTVMRDNVDRRLEELRNLTASLVLEVEQAGAQVRIDGKLVGLTPLPESLYMSPGGHDIEVELDGYETAKVRVDLVPRQEVTKTIVLEKPKPPPPPPPQKVTPPPPAPVPPPAPPPQDSHTLNTVGWITAGVGTALLAGGTVTGIWALSVDGDLNDACVDGHCTADKSSDIDRLDTLTTTTNVLLGAGFLATTAGVVMILSDQPASRETASTAAGMSFGPGHVGATIRQRF